jgi:hypothetical protein
MTTSTCSKTASWSAASFSWMQSGCRAAMDVGQRPQRRHRTRGIRL